MKKKNDNIPNCKVTLLGDSGVGKSSIIARFVSGIFMKDSISTSGGSYSQKIYEKNGNKIRLNIWDTVGQEKFRALGKNFYKDAYIICIVYDITNKQSFNNVKEIWYPDVQKYGEKFNIISIIGNKCDKFEEEEVNEEDAKSFTNEIGAKFFLVSALNGNGITNMFNALANNYLNPEFEDKVRESFKNKNNSFKLKKKDFHTKKKNNKSNCC